MKKLIILLTILFLFTSKYSLSQFSIIYDFQGGINGSFPFNSLFFDGTYLYGTTVWGGTNSVGAHYDGTIFKIKPDGTGYSELFEFDGTTSGRMPYGSLFSDGNFMYGMTKAGGTNDFGTIFKIKPDGTGFLKLLDFNGINGSEPWGSFISDGTFLYGMTMYGGLGYGTIFKIKPDGTGYNKLLDFSDSLTGSYPYGDLIYDGTFLYGTAAAGGTHYMGTVFKIKPDGTGFAKLLNGAVAPNINCPYGSLISDGTFLYGTSGTGGVNDFGTVFKIKPDGTNFVKLFDFDSINGRQVMGSLILEGGFLYGMTEVGGSNNLGTIFKIKTDGTGFTKLVDFAGTINGSYPHGSLISDGTFLYGMTPNGGTSNGVIFKLSLKNVGVTEIKIAPKIILSPNPSNGIFTVNTIIIKQSEVEIHNIVGELIYKTSTTTPQTTIDLSRQPKGIYFVQVTDTNKNIANKKIVIQ